MLFQRFLGAISNLLPERAFLGNPEALAKLNTEKFYVENVRSILGVSSRSAERIIETGVRQGIFQRRIEVVRPDGSVAIAVESEGEIPEIVRWWKEEDGNYEEVVVATRDLSRNVFYCMTDGEVSAKHHPQPA